MKTLVVGGSGYLGGAFTDQFDPYYLTVYDNLTYESDYLKLVEFVYGDIRDRKKLKQQLKKVDAVVWLAALVGDGACALNPALSEEINAQSVKWLADNFDGRIIFMSTCSVYGAQDGILTEDSPTNPLSVYAATKLEAEGYLKNKNAVIFRLGTLYGVGDTYSRIRLDLVLNIMTLRAITEGKVTVFGGEQFRPLLHVNDAAYAITEALKAEHTGIYNLHQNNMKMIDLAMEIREHTNCKIETVKTSFEDSRNYRVDSSKASKDFNFKPRFTTATGISDISRVVKEGRIKDMNSPRYSNERALSETI